MGQYAVAVTWGDGHHTGYYTFTLLREQCPCATCARDRGQAHPDQRGPAAPTGGDTPLAWRASMIIATTPFVAGYRVAETKGQVFGLVVRSRGLAGNIVAGLRSLVGGEIHEYTSCSRTPAARRSTAWSRTRRSWARTP